MTENIDNNVRLLAINNLSAAYGTKDVLSGVTLHVNQGEVVTVIGPNGCGKSTLLKAIAGVVTPKSGSVLLQGNEISKRKAHEIARLGLTFLMQGDAVFPSLSVMEHLRFANRISQQDKLNGHFEIVWKLFPSLFPIRNRRAGLLSGGEKQSLAFSMVLVSDARLWLLDEPTTRLATQLGEALITTISRISAEQRVGVLLVEQNLSLGLRAADRAYVLKHGMTYSIEDPSKILEDGNLEEIFFQ